MKSGKRAAAVGYDSRDPAPKILARGSGEIAENLVRVAREAGVDVLENAELAEALSRRDVGSLIPEELYVALAEILAFVYRVKGNG